MGTAVRSLIGLVVLAGGGTILWMAILKTNDPTTSEVWLVGLLAGPIIAVVGFWILLLPHFNRPAPKGHL
ncbi:hypothetical protein HY523_01495 [Candidatus Berkelbacteria bacterium]|nr:hypothetical protein [Candidatus Berkelbacteria bacterium]